jgi:pimeloyl-ACP methyl ester carboxylesterase
MPVPRPAPSPRRPDSAATDGDGSPRATTLPELAFEYAIDAWQRSILFWDVLRQRGNQYVDQTAKAAPHVLSFGAELLVDGRTLEQPVNYVLVRIVPPDNVECEAAKRPFVVIDPRAGHGPGIGGFKADSEIGVILQAGHPCYFIGFLPEPVPGQTIEHVGRAEALFLEAVAARHPAAEGKPCVIGNCQAGWALMGLAALRPDLVGPILIAGAPLSYWAGAPGNNPMRYTGGLLGGSWLTMLMGDLGHGTFDGVHLVQNFENLNPANTLWSKQYNVYANVDTEAPRYLEFEKWWGGHVVLNAEEMQFIVDELFIGNKLSSGDLVTSRGNRIDLRSITSPIVVFCSQGDNITPPEQALSWILDLYDRDEDILAYGQTIVYALHHDIGHLGIFVSGRVARKEHQEFTQNMDMIDVVPPGLYEAVIRKKRPGDAHLDLVEGDHIVALEPRKLDDLRTLCGRDPQDDMRFATVARVSEINQGLYKAFVQPWVQAAASEPLAEWLRQMHPLRLQYTMFSDSNPLMAPVAALAESVRANRAPAAPDNPFLAWQEMVSGQIVQTLENYRETRDTLCEAAFQAIYDMPALQALAGLRSDAAEVRRRAGRGVEHQAKVAKEIEALKSRIDWGGAREAFVRSVLFVRMADAKADERSFAAVKQLRATREDRLPLADFKALLREQYLMLRLDEKAAVAALPHLLKDRAEQIPAMRAALSQILEASGPLGGAETARLRTVESAFAAAAQAARTDRAEPRKPAPPAKEKTQAGTARVPETAH